MLVIDDHDGVRTLVCRILEMNGITTSEAKNGRLALASLTANTFDAVTLDLMMPELNGYEVIEELARSRPDVLAQVIVMTAYPKTALEKIAGQCEVISKPFNATELLAAVNRVARRA